MSTFEWIMIAFAVFATNGFSFLFMMRAEKFRDRAEAHLKDSRAALRALDEAIALLNYGAQDEAVQLLKEHGIGLKERA